MENERKKFGVKKIVSIIAAATLIIIGCVFVNAATSPAQYGYKMCKDDLKEFLYVPDSLKVTEVVCYETENENTIIPTTVYVYKISYKCENKLGMEINDVVYYVYNDIYEDYICFGEDASPFLEARTDGNKKFILK